MLLNKLFATFCTHPAYGHRGATHAGLRVSVDVVVRDGVDKRLACVDTAGYDRDAGLRVFIAYVNKADTGTRVTFES